MPDRTSPDHDTARGRVGVDQPAPARPAGEERDLRRIEQLANDLRNVILPLGVQLSVEKNVDRLLEQIVIEAKALCHADAGTLYLRTRDDRLKFSIMRTDSLGIALGGTTGPETPYPPLRLYDPETGRPNEHNVATCVAHHGRAVNIADIYTAEAFDFSRTKAFDQANGYRSVSTLTVPMKDSEDQVIAVLQLLNAQDPAGAIVPFDEYQALVVESLASQASVALNNALLLQRQKELLTFERDLQIGRQIQAGFLPDVLPQPAGWETAARFLPAREVAGDFYDAFMLGDDQLGLVIADVCDKGVGAAIFMALVRSLVRAYAQQRFSIDAPTRPPAARATLALRDALVQTNDYIGENHGNMNMFATVFAAVVDCTTGRVAHINGGHNPPLVAGPAGIKYRLAPSGPAVGMLAHFDYRVEEVTLEPGETLVAFTDGATDARSPQGEFFSEARLLALVEEAGAGVPAETYLVRIQEHLLAHMTTAAQFDDITLLAVRRLPAA